MSEQELFAEAWRYLHKICQDAPALKLAREGAAPIETAKKISELIRSLAGGGESSGGNEGSEGNDTPQSTDSELTPYPYTSEDDGDGDGDNESIPDTPLDNARPSGNAPAPTPWTGQAFADAYWGLDSAVPYTPTPGHDDDGSDFPTYFEVQTPSPSGAHNNDDEYALYAPTTSSDLWGLQFLLPLRESATPRGTPLLSLGSALSPVQPDLGPPSASSPYYRRTKSPSLPAQAPFSTPVPASPSPAPVQDPSKFPCCLCNHICVRKKSLQQHMIDRHCGTRCYWPGCGHTTATENELLRHLMEHQKRAVRQGLPDTLCPWPGCDNSFSRDDSVRRCLKKHTRAALRGS